MSVMMELDPIFVKALKLLQSKAKDSGPQLKAMLDDVIAQRKGLKIPSQSGDAERLGSSKSRIDDDGRKKDGDKRFADKVSKDSSEPDFKRQKLDQKLKSSSERDAREKEKERERLKRDKEKKEKEEKEAQRQKDKADREKKEKESLVVSQDKEIEIPSDEEEQGKDTEEFAFSLGISCIVCKQFDVTSGNQLVECQECRSLYHQECHKPPVTGEDVSDPRFVWYCSKCTKSLKKMVTHKVNKPAKPATTLLGSKELATSSSKSVKSDSSLGSQAFRKIDPKAIVTPKEISSSTTKPMMGLAGLAANLTKPRGDSKHTSALKKSEHQKDKGDCGKSSSSRPDGKVSSSSKQDGSSKSSSSPFSSSLSSSSSAVAKDKGKAMGKEDREKEKEKDKKADSKSKSDDRKSSDGSSKRDREDRKSFDSKSTAEKSSSKSDSSSSKSPSDSSPDHSGSKGSSNNSSNKQAIANLSMVTQNKRMQMMKKKAQAKPQDKKSK